MKCVQKCHMIRLSIISVTFLIQHGSSIHLCLSLSHSICLSPRIVELEVRGREKKLSRTIDNRTSKMGESIKSSEHGSQINFQFERTKYSVAHGLGSTFFFYDSSICLGFHVVNYLVFFVMPFNLCI